MATPTNLKVDGLNFEQIKDNLKEFLKTRDNFVDVNFEASGIQMLLDVLAYNTYYNATYLNLASNESFLATAQRRNSIVNLARTLNYTPRSTTSAYRDWETDRKSTRLNSSHSAKSRMPSSA